MRHVIIESPFAGATPELAARNLRYLRAAMRWCLLQGWAPFASHGLYTQAGVLRDDIPEERALGLLAGFAWRSGAEATCVFHDLGFTTGMRAGIKDAESLIEKHNLLVEALQAKCRRLGLPFEDKGAHVIEYRLLGGEWDLGLSEQGRP